MNAKIHAVICRLNLVRPVCFALLGHRARHTHRMAAGTVVMTCGVIIAHAAGGMQYEVLKMFMDGIGYGLHGLGLTPFIELLSERLHVNEDK